MKILHTSDWHLGVTFEGISREEDHKFFLKWLIQTLSENEIDVFIIAGDIFDQPQPSAEAQKIYYQFLFHVSQKTFVKKVIILGGNHDSPTRLDAPSELLKLLDVFVVGGITSELNSLSRYLCPIYNEDGKIELVVAVVPFVHEYRLGVRTAFQSENEIQQSFKEKITQFYKNLADEAERISEGAPIISTGHLACVGCESDDAPLEVHMVGTLGGLPKEIFDPRFSYIALGHIHRSYRVENSNAYYCGSPIPLSIKESKSPRFIQIVSFLDKANKDPIIVKLEVPLRRKIQEIRGNIDEIFNQIKNLTWETPEPPILCAQVSVDLYMAGIDLEIRKKINHYFPKKPPALASVRQNPNTLITPIQSSHEMISLKDLTTEQVFMKMCESQNQVVDNDLLKAFRSLLNEENI
jgi:DNA repair protein SbcD/Mre11